MPTVNPFRLRTSSKDYRLPTDALILLLCLAATSTAKSFGQSAAPTTQNEPLHQLRGQVVNALDGSPIPRALVTINARSLLTDAQGRFEFVDFVGSTAFASVRKPGFNAHSDHTAGFNGQGLTNLDAPLLLRLSPDATIFGQLTGSDGTPLSHVQIRLLQPQYEGSSTRWTTVQSGQTNSRGEYRMSAGPGRFRFISSFVQQSFETGEAILPTSFPDPSQSVGSTSIELRSGEERRVDLRTATGPVYPVNLSIDIANEPGNFPVSVTTSHGEVFFVGQTADHRLLLPAGSYSLRVQVDKANESLSGFARVNVIPQGTPTVLVRLVPDSLFSLEVQADPSTASAPTSNVNNVNKLLPLPNVAQFNLYLNNQDLNADTINPGINVKQLTVKSTGFRVPPGQYRLAASGGSGPWHVQAATLGSQDLLRNDLIVGSGSAGGTIRIVVSDQMGTVHGRVRLAENATAWMYLIPREPGLTPVYPVPVTATGSALAVATVTVPPGSYTALVLEERLPEDLRDPAFLASFSSGLKEIDVQANADQSFSLDLAKRKAADQ